MNRDIAGNCDCLSQMNDAISKMEPGVGVGFAWNTKTGATYVSIPLVRIDGTNKRIKHSMNAKFCPFCGREYDKAESEATQ